MGTEGVGGEGTAAVAAAAGFLELRREALEDEDGRWRENFVRSREDFREGIWGSSIAVGFVGGGMLLLLLLLSLDGRDGASVVDGQLGLLLRSASGE